MLSRLTSRPRIALALLAAALGGFALLFAANATKAPADFNDNTRCWGTIAQGEPDPDDPAAVGVRYVIQCDGTITGYSIATAPERRVLGVETEVAVLDGNRNVVPTDSFSCNGTFPGYGINCVSPPGGDYRTPGNFIEGTFFVNRDICKGPARLDPLLTVSYATTNSKGLVVQSMAGPFDLYFGKDCAAPPKGRAYKKWRKAKIPYSNDVVLTGDEEEVPASASR